MHLQRIELHGFKTFATRTAIELRPGITAVVGPNGSGKSNIADAVRWALGETNLRQVRCRSTNELIFAGSARKASLGMAEVSLIFANDGGWLALPFTEVRVTRRAYRSGDNEYLLNGTRVRLRDVVDLLAGASIHAGGHVVIGQGLVDAVLALRPEERRTLVENLAGLKHYYLRRDDAETRLAGTDANLLQVDTLIAELSPQVASLAEQAKILRIYRTLREEMQVLQGMLFGVQARRLQARVLVATEATAEAGVTLAAARAEAAELRAEEDLLLARLREMRAVLAERREQLRRQTAVEGAARRDRDVAQAQLLAAREHGRLAREECDLLRERVQAARQGSDTATVQHAAARTDALDAENGLRERRSELARMQSVRDAALARYRAAEMAMQDAQRQQTALEERINRVTIALTASQTELQRLESAALAASSALEEAERSLAAAGTAATVAQEEARRARALESDARLRHEEARSAVGAAMKAATDAHAASVEAVARWHALRDWHARLEGYGTAVRDLAGHPAVEAIVGEALQVEPIWSAPLVSLLARQLEGLILADPAPLIALDDGTGPSGQVQLVVLDHAIMDEGAADRCGTMSVPDILADDELCGRASDVVVAPRMPGLIAALRLDRVLLLRDVTTLLRCRSALAARGFGAVAAGSTLALLLDGTLVYGKDERAVDVLQRREQLAALEETAGTRTAQMAEARARLDAERTTAERLEGAHAGSRRVAGQSDAAATRARDEVRFQERLAARARQEVQAAQAALARLRGSRKVDSARRDDEMRRRDDLHRRRDDKSTALAEAHGALTSAEEQLATAMQAIRDDEAVADRLHERLATAAALERERRRGVEALVQDLARRVEQTDRAGMEEQTLLLTVRQTSARADEAQRISATLDQEIVPLELRIGEAQERQAALRARQQVVEERLGVAEPAHDRARREQEASSRDLEVLRAQVAAELGCGLADLPETVPPPGAAARLRTLRAQLSGMGLVNARAEEDHAVAAERLRFLDEQATDLRAGTARLRGIIAEANATVRERFVRTVESLDEHFSLFFTRLFGGGTCRLVASFDDHGLPSGMDVQAQPPGKRTRDLALLSGGERALAALALLFAMLKVRPVPFCLLDEVEAALDESNTGRFGAILRELSAETQFLLITHNRGSMLHADALYGVTMSDTGVSTTASVALARDENDVLLSYPAALSDMQPPHEAGTIPGA